MPRWPGYVIASETRQKIAASLRGRKPVWTGQPRSVEHRARLSASGRGRVLTSGVGPDRHGWKGEDAGYMAKHNWIRRQRGPASRQQCQCCARPAQEWANVSGEYRRDVNDFIPLCLSCHRRLDARGRARRAG